MTSVSQELASYDRGRLTAAAEQLRTAMGWHAPTMIVPDELPGVPETNGRRTVIASEGGRRDPTSSDADGVAPTDS
jgi:hypothetical protein